VKSGVPTATELKQMKETVGGVIFSAFNLGGHAIWKKSAQVVAKNEMLKEFLPGKIRREEHVNIGVSFARQKRIRHTIKTTSKSILIVPLLAMLV
jgi:hypothetical protein